ncbi:WG repeat-containing protein [Bryobacter aggregatus]|uniref:WG repeat-containing protein n=1 Tax=Bryobacter aggregatus TaxID=360054 RepID=UPI00068E45EB|nr:WG repeat-containing protein [Bryobacter aggregatus]
MSEQLDRAYSILEIRPLCTLEEARAAYLDLVKIWHPDRHQAEPERLRRKAEEKLKEIVEAFELVSKQGEFAEEVALIAMDFGELWGYIDENGKTAIHPEFTQARAFVSGLAAVQSVAKWGFIDKTGQWRINPLYEDCADFAEGLAAVRWYGRWGYVDSQGKFAIAPRYQEAKSFVSGWAEVKLGARWGKVNPSGDLVFDPTRSGRHLETSY